MSDALHPRTTLIRAVRERLIGATVAGDRVYLNRLKPLFEKHTPCLLLYAMEEDVAENSYERDGHAPLSRTLKIGIEIVFGGKGDEVIEDMDQTAELVERSLDGWQVAGFEPSVLRLQRTDFTAIENKEMPYLLTRMTYDTGYLTPRYQQGQFYYEDSFDGGTQSLPSSTDAEGSSPDQQG